MTNKVKIALLMICSLCLLRPANCYAGIEQYVKYLNGPFTAGSSFYNKDKAFLNSAYTWSTINNLSVKDAVTLRVMDSVFIGESFTATLTLDVKYYTSPDTVDNPPKDTTVTLKVKYVPGQGKLYKGIDGATFTGGYEIKVTVTAVSTSVSIPGLSLQLSSNIVINRKYAFPSRYSLAPVYTPNTNGVQMTATWTPLNAAEEYDLEWTTINDGNDYFNTINTEYLNPAIIPAGRVTQALNSIFRNNASRITLPGDSYTLSLLSTDTYVVFRIRPVQYLPNGVRETMPWIYITSTGSFAIYPLNWHQPNLNWQYSAAYAEDGKKKEVVSYFDGSLRGRQTVTLNNTDNIALAQENIYDAFGRPAASILPAPFVDSSGNAYLHYNINFNRNTADSAYNRNNLNTLGDYCEWAPDSLSTKTGAARYYSAKNDFYNHDRITGKPLYNSYIPNAQNYPLSVTQYTADNTGRIKVQGGVGEAFQPGLTTNTGASYTTKYFYGKPEQDELDQLFGNDVGFAEHYLKNMVVDPNGQISVSYINASGKTIATALSGKAPATMDTLASYVEPSLNVSTLHILTPGQFVYNSSNMTLTASTTYLNAVIDTGTLAFSMQQLIDKFPGGADSICSNCFYQMTVNVTNDCGDTVATTRTPVNIGSSSPDCSDTTTYTNSLKVYFQSIGEYYVTIQFALNTDTITAFTNNFITQGTSNGFIQQEAYYIKQHYLDSIQVSGCYSDCSTCYTLLGTQSSFVTKVQNELIAEELDSVAVRGTVFTNWAIYLYNKLIDSCAASQAHCFNPCQSVQDQMEQDVSPGGQYALFDSTGVATEAAINVLSNNWRVVFPVKSSGDPVYIANEITETNGTVTSPNDASFTLPALVAYWQPQWAALFLQYHPEYCKLVFCNSMSAYETWDSEVQNINMASEVNQIPGGSSLTYNYTNASDWLLSADPLFQTGAPGNSYLSAMRTDLLNYSKNVMNILTDSLAVKGLMKVIDYDIYCNGTIGSNTNTSDNANNWNYCTPNVVCRDTDREWRMYRDDYLALKQKYYTLLRNAACGDTSICQAGQPVTFSLPGSAATVSDFSLAPDTGATSACVGSQSMVLTRSMGTDTATVLLYYPPNIHSTGLTKSVYFASTDTRKTFCVPDTIPLSSILIAGLAGSGGGGCAPLIDTPSITLYHAFSSVLDQICEGGGPDIPRNTYLTHAVLVNSSGSPVNATRVVKVAERYHLEYPATPYTPASDSYYVDTLTIPIGQSISNYNPYIASAGFYPGSGTYCYIYTTSPYCIASIKNAKPPSGSSTCSDFTDTIACPPAPPPSPCPAVYTYKQTRFPQYQGPPAGDISPADTTPLIANTNAAIIQQAAGACNGNVSTLMDSLQAGLTAVGVPIAIQDTLSAKLFAVCIAGVDLNHATGVSDITGDTNHGPTAYYSFAGAMKGVLGTTYLPHFTPALNPWLTPGPFPWLTPQQSTPETTSNSNPDICNLLDTLTTRATGAGMTLYNYLVSTYGAAMTLSAGDLANLQNSCNNCRFIIKNQVTLPVFLMPGAKGCINASDFTIATDSLNILFGGSIDTANAHYQNIFSNYMNQRFGFALTYDDYAAYRALLVTTPTATLCNEMPFTTASVDSASCLNNALAMAVANGKQAYDNYIDSLKGVFLQSYVNTCKLAQANAKLQAKQQTYHYTLYYYDQADNLVRTVPPEGVTLVNPSLFATINSTRAAEAMTDSESTRTHIYPATVLPTNYTYNSTNQVSMQSSPDGGVNRYWYDLLSRLTISQNDVQNPASNYSYTKYDSLGRIVEVGQANETTVNIGNPDYLPSSTITNFYAASTNTQITNTYYDAPVNFTIDMDSLQQNNLRKRVSASTYSNDNTGVTNATYYSYDIDGNVQTLWQQVQGMQTRVDDGLKRIDYEYDLVSGKVNFVRYQDGQPDAFYYAYSYDADNRLTDAWSGTKAMVDTLTHSILLPGNGKKDAHYAYYLHGPLARMELGDTTGRVQGTDYAYTLQGWLKGVNDTKVKPVKDMGQDSLYTAKDAYGYALYYYYIRSKKQELLDYKPIGGDNPFSKTPDTLSTYNPLFNGNIAAMSTNIAQLTKPWHYYTYQYDQLNRVRQSSVYRVKEDGIDTLAADYHENFKYDGNGNIDSVSRYKANGVIMDSLGYNYNLDVSGRLVNNQLNYITNANTVNNWPYGVTSQRRNNYTYDATGNMISDIADSLQHIGWTVYGKIQNIQKNSRPLRNIIDYSYDAAGNRVMKSEGSTSANSSVTYYIRDAQGNPLALYERIGNSPIARPVLQEMELFGSSRLGRWRANVSQDGDSTAETAAWDTVGKKEYELTNHLGNVWATITDKRIQHSSGRTVDYFEPDVSTAQEYYAFGGLMPQRTYSYGSSYRYGFNGKENDNEVKGVGNQQNYGERISDPRVGRFLSVDPISSHYPQLTPYQFASNSPISGIDQDGLEYFYSMNGNKGVKLGQIGSNTEVRLIDKAIPFAKAQEMFSSVHSGANDASTLNNVSKAVGISFEALNTKAMMMTVRFTEYGDDGVLPYNAIHGFYKDSQAPFTGVHKFDDFTHFPYKWKNPATGVTGNSIAVGAYQIQGATYDYLKSPGQQDIFPKTQDLMFLKLVNGKNALSQLESGDINTFALKLKGVWTSLPGGKQEGSILKNNPGLFQSTFEKFIGQELNNTSKIGSTNADIDAALKLLNKPK